MDKQLSLWLGDDGFTVASQPVNTPPPVTRKQSETTAAVRMVTQCKTTTVTPSPCDEAIPRLVTSGVIVEETGATWARVDHILRTRPDIRPAAYAGLTRLFHRESVARVRHELNAIDARYSTNRGGNQ